jgi:hypothetical protein
MTASRGGSVLNGHQHACNARTAPRGGIEPARIHACARRMFASKPRPGMRGRDGRDRPNRLAERPGADIVRTVT